MRESRTYGSVRGAPRKGCPYRNPKFVAGMVRDYGNLPGLGAASLYINGMVTEAALEKTGGKTDDKNALIAALRTVSLDDTPRGRFHFDHLGNVVGNIFIRRC
jgi:branched-chain amino acid transport system substrate-binding protein